MASPFSAMGSDLENQEASSKGLEIICLEDFLFSRPSSQWSLYRLLPAEAIILSVTQGKVSCASPPATVGLLSIPQHAGCGLEGKGDVSCLHGL